MLKTYILNIANGICSIVHRGVTVWFGHSLYIEGIQIQDITFGCVWFHIKIIYMFCWTIYYFLLYFFQRDSKSILLLYFYILLHDSIQNTIYGHCISYIFCYWLIINITNTFFHTWVFCMFIYAYLGSAAAPCWVLHLLILIFLSVCKTTQKFKAAKMYENMFPQNWNQLRLILLL